MRNLVKDHLGRMPVNASREHLRAFAAEAAAVGKDPSFRVLDAGAGKLPYKSLFAHVSYEAADVVAEPGLDYVCDIAKMPVPDDTYDLVFCSQTLEHVPNPVAVLREFHRILKPGGQAWLSAPLFYPEHVQPYDYFRYTRFAWRKMARRAGFTVADISWLEGYFGTLSYQLEMAYKALPADMKVWRYTLLHLSRKLAKRELTERYLPRKGMPKNYKVKLVKPAA
ncbi:class I SAM-dependent methyltransferase [Nocardioides sp.]|uniref:class I SAM-dependent methyltransferase n=1 Tax=Nocardioides sp. TaxID=35761 RepID=UPI00356390AB